MRKLIIPFGCASSLILLLNCNGVSKSNNDIQKAADTIALQASQSGENSNFDGAKTGDAAIVNKPKLVFDQWYPILKRSLLKTVCESYRIEEISNGITVYSKESGMFLSSWEWDFNNQPLLIKDIDQDNLIDYTIELSNTGGGCGGQLGESERWTLFGSKPDRFVWTHTIPYRSESGKWEKN